MEEERWSKAERDVLKELSEEAFDIANLKKRLEKELVDQGLINRTTLKSNKMKRTIIQIAASILILISGYFIGKMNSQETINTPNMNTYALFLYENNEFVVDDPGSLVAEYSTWARQLAGQEKLAYAEKLNDDQDFWLGKPTVQNHTSKLTGYFVFYAPDFAEAKKIAATHPHTKYGGGLELRPIDKID